MASAFFVTQSLIILELSCQFRFILKFLVHFKIGCPLLERSHTRKVEFHVVARRTILSVCIVSY